MISSDLNWLPTSILKDLPPIKVVYEPYKDQNYGGYYIPGFNEMVVVVGEEYEDLVASTIAHELKHHIQYCNGFSFEHSKNFSIEQSYEESINVYFSTQPLEYEALLFEYKHSKNWLNDWWLKKLVHRN